MSKTYLMQVQKAQALATGLRTNIDKVKGLGIGQDKIDELEKIAAEAERLNSEVDALREQTNIKVAEANQKLIALKTGYQEARHIIKGHFEQPQWESFGLMDKR